jgi:hypothetical protein
MVSERSRNLMFKIIRAQKEGLISVYQKADSLDTVFCLFANKTAYYKEIPQPRFSIL